MDKIQDVIHLKQETIVYPSLKLILILIETIINKGFFIF
jgi:hypothetical protein